MLEIATLLAVAGATWLVWDGLKAREAANAAMRAACNAHGLLFLDDTVALASLRPAVPAGMTMPQLALRHILAHPAISTVIPGMRKLGHVEQNIAVSDGQPLPAANLAELKSHRWNRTVDIE